MPRITHDRVPKRLRHRGRSHRLVEKVRRGLADLYDRLLQDEHGRVGLSARHVEGVIGATAALRKLRPVMREKLAAAIVREHLTRRSKDGFVEAGLNVWTQAEARKAASILVATVLHAVFKSRPRQRRSKPHRSRRSNA